MNAEEAKLLATNTNTESLIYFIDDKILDAAQSGLYKITLTIPNLNKPRGQGVLKYLRAKGYKIKIHTINYPEDDEINMTIGWEL